MAPTAQEGGMIPALYKAVAQGDVKGLRKLVVADVKILNSTTPQRNTALHLAALQGHTGVAREVLNVSQEMLVAKNVDGDTALHLAAKTGRLKVAELLISLARGWPDDPNTEDTLLKSPLLMTNKAGNSPLHEAAQHRKAAVALALLDADPNRGYDLNEQMESPLHMAAREGLVHVVRQIVDFAWVEARYVPSVSVSGTALHQAVLGGHTRIVEILLEKRHDLIDLTDSDGNNALHYAAKKNHSHAVELLLNNKPELAYKPNNELQSPLHVAAHYGSTEAIKALLRHCPDVAEMVDSCGRNALHVSVTSGKTNALRCLLRHVHHAELLNRVDGNGNTPLQLAAEMSRVQSALLLLKDRRVDPCVCNRSGHTARSLLEIRSTHGGTSRHDEISSTHGYDGHTAHSLVEIHSANAEMDAYEMYLWKKLKHQESIRCRKQQLPPVTFARDRRTSSHKYFEHSAETYILVATLIATVTFAATFTMPGGYDQTNGIALHGHNTAFKIFVISNTVAMCSSIVVVFCFIWAWKDPIKFKVEQLHWGHRLTVVACLAMLISLMSAVYITVAPTSRWPAYVVIAIGVSTPAVVFLMLGKEAIFVPL
ncbi:ankyrin repeat-containing protein ITN1-like [Phragmites australis]|uniref:ankyrin repeat-containing protein ITN1-like n=1 Tax=Phragmites australis TaxID=29695 RepID=UPI002D76F073|nr:ankyrin repeat-containing protein ITN1-like [Phragmites australis]